MPPEGTAAVLDIREPACYAFDDYEDLGKIYHYTDDSYSCFGIVENGEWQFAVPMWDGHIDEASFTPEEQRIVRWAPVPFLHRTNVAQQTYEGDEAKAVAERLKDVPFVCDRTKLDY